MVGHDLTPRGDGPTPDVPLDARASPPPLALGFIDALGRVTPTNPAARALLGSAPPRLDDLVVADDREQVRTVLHELLSGARTQAVLDLTWQANHDPARRVRLWLLAVDDPDAPGVALVAEDRTEEHLAHELLRASEERARALVDDAADVLARLDVQGRVTEVAVAVRGRFGWEPAALVGRSIFELVHPDDVEAARVVGNALLAGRATVAATYRLRRGDNGFVWVEASATVVRDPRDATLTSVVVSVRDLEDRRRAQMRFEIAFDRAPTAMALIERFRGGSSWTRVNLAFCELVALPAEAIIALGVDLVHPADRHRIEPLVALVDAGEAGAVEPVEVRLRRADHTEVWTKVFATVSEPGGEGIIHVVDVTAEHDLQEQLRHRALYDTLTGLPNRALLHDRLTLALAEAGRAARHVGVCFVDIDRLKEANDAFGHAHGDLVITELARALSDASRPGDTAARLAGDEFVVVVADLAADAVDAMSDLVAVAERILDRSA
ncbi:MAG TPA: diguanylate cyclase, partial [Acidimicrobiales bacterium]|nr:diguanylate cyclase [Acidimicrobiales bacterium]